MIEYSERQCVICDTAGEFSLLERCIVCSRYYCPDCAFRGYGRRFCTEKCGRTYFCGDEDDDGTDDADYDDE